MAGSIIRYKLPGDRPRRRTQRERKGGEGPWNPPEIEPDDVERAPRSPGVSVGASAIAAFGVGMAVFFGWPLWGLLGATMNAVALGALAVTLVTFVTSRVFPGVLGRLEFGGTTGRGQVYTRLAHSGILLVFTGLFVWNVEGLAVLIAVVPVALAIGWPLHTWLRYRRFREIGELPDESDLLLE